MGNSFGISMKKPVAVWNKPLKVNFKDLFKALSKAAIAGLPERIKTLVGRFPGFRCGWNSGLEQHYNESQNRPRILRNRGSDSEAATRGN